MSERLKKLKASFQDEDDYISIMEMHELLVGSLAELQAAEATVKELRELLEECVVHLENEKSTCCNNGLNKQEAIVSKLLGRIKED